MKYARKIELLSPARNLQCGIEAINHGADAVYIGAPRFSARAAAGNSLRDIEELVHYAHQYYARVYVAFNTILKDDELETAAQTALQLSEVGVDALIVQDMALTRMDIPIPLHASTQMDNRSMEKVKFLEDIGFSQVVLARELSLAQIREVAEQVTVPLEVFVHGALCVSYSGQCYLSQSLSGRSANRGECAQYCRLPYTLQDASGKTLASDKHLLSLKDMNRSDYLEDLLDAGVSSLKIEGRLKDLSYVKNVTAYYRKKLDDILLRRPEYIPASSGSCRFRFLPNVDKAFNRRFTDYFLKGRSKEITSFDTPKFIGEPIGKVKNIGKNYLEIKGRAQLSNGDGIAFFNTQSRFQGFRVNRVEGERIYPAEMPDVTPNTLLYRNYDHQLEKDLSQKTAERKLSLNLVLNETLTGFNLFGEDEDGISATVHTDWAKEQAQKDQTEQIKAQLSKLGNTIYEAGKVRIDFQQAWFLPASLLSNLRRDLVEALLLQRKESYPMAVRRQVKEQRTYPQKELSYLGNVSNTLAKEAYRQHGVEKIGDAYEISAQAHVPLMFTKHCLKYSLGYCPKEPGNLHALIKEPLYLLSQQGRLELEFDCKACEMRVYRSL